MRQRWTRHCRLLWCVSPNLETDVPTCCVPKVAYLGYVLERTGYGTAARAYVGALRSACVPSVVMSLDPIRAREIPQALADWYDRPGFDPQFHLWHVEPHELVPLKGRFPRAVSVTTWETDRLPAHYVQALNRVAEVWVPSTFNQEVFAGQLRTPVYRLPHPVHDLGVPRYSREELDREMNWTPGSFVFLAVGTWQERKNLGGVIEAFLRAFPRESDVRLVVKTSFSFTPEPLARAHIAQAGARARIPFWSTVMQRIHIYPQPWPAECLASLYARADCYVSLHRGEGWCYPLFDAACAGTPVVATGYSGPMDYLDPCFHRLVRFELTHAAREGQGPRFSFDASMQWAEPDIEHAALQMRAVYENHAEARRQAETCAERLRHSYSMEAVGRIAASRLQILADGRSSWPSNAEPVASTPSMTGNVNFVTTRGRALDSPSCPPSCS
jgi:glycosyltransferase involved in cell wall biosynthesis